MPLAEAEGVTLRLEMVGGSQTVEADAARLHQVFGNLLANALRFAPLGQTGAPEVCLSLAGRSGLAYISVADNGPGLSVEARLTLCNLTVELGAKTGFIAPDATTLDWCDARLPDATARGGRWIDQPVFEHHVRGKDTDKTAENLRHNV